MKPSVILLMSLVCFSQTVASQPFTSEYDYDDPEDAAFGYCEYLVNHREFRSTSKEYEFEVCNQLVLSEPRFGNVARYSVCMMHQLSTLRRHGYEPRRRDLTSQRIGCGGPVADGIFRVTRDAVAFQETLMNSPLKNWSEDAAWAMNMTMREYRDSELAVAFVCEQIAETAKHDLRTNDDAASICVDLYSKNNQHRNAARFDACQLIEALRFRTVLLPDRFVAHTSDNARIQSVCLEELGGSQQVMEDVRAMRTALKNSKMSEWK
ncbi:MAG: hypothetical protein JJ850_06550 [Kordiimonadaceae bacterium]|nr:hypothetical protein [Kordiimonadaceae bacterium]MBO6568013.1 hypothetical protein [Kordiimonadaceae bacterium]MBO6964257.1 hypothetical protein [Kordiimonadaceae bacterium]